MITSLTSSAAVIVQKLDNHSRDLATLLGLLGDANIPKSMLLRAAEPKGFFNRAGEIDYAPPPDLNPLFACKKDLNRALQSLESLAFISFVGITDIRVQPKLRSLIDTKGDARRNMEYKASLLVFHSFPVDPDAGYDEL